MPNDRPVLLARTWLARTNEIGTASSACSDEAPVQWLVSVPPQAPAASLLRTSVGSLSLRCRQSKRAQSRQSRRGDGPENNHLPGWPLPDHQQAKRQQGKAEVGRLLDGCQPYGEIQSRQQDADDGRVNAIERALEGGVPAEAAPKRQ